MSAFCADIVCTAATRVCTHAGGAACYNRLHMPELQQKSTRLNCFSPPVMIATMVIETILAVYTVWRYKMSDMVRLAAITLLGLATFQLAEFFVCTGSIGHTIEWSRFG